MVFDIGEDQDGMEDGEKEEEKEEEVEGKRMSTRQWAESIEYDPLKIFHKVRCTETSEHRECLSVHQLFYTDIHYLLTMDKLWQTRQPPTPLSVNQLPCDSEGGRGREGGAEHLFPIATAAEDSSVLPDQRLWSVRKCADTFFNWCVVTCDHAYHTSPVMCCCSIHQLREVQHSEGELVWDKVSSVACFPPPTPPSPTFTRTMPTTSTL